MRRLNLVQKFALLSSVCIAALSLSLAVTISTLLEKHMLVLEWESVAEIAKYQVEEHNLAQYFTDEQLRQQPARYRKAFGSLLRMPEVVRIKIWDREARVLWSDDERLIGQQFADNSDVRQALAGQVSAHVKTLPKREHEYERGRFRRLAEVYAPITSKASGEIIGIVEVYKLPTRLFATVHRMRLIVWTIAISGGILLFATLLPIVRRSYRVQLELQASLERHAGDLEERSRKLQEANLHLEALARKANEASRSKSDFLANISHELRTPLNAIIGFSALLEQRLHGALTEKQSRYVANIHKSGKLLLAVINDILDLSKAEAGKLDLSCQPVDLAEAVQECLTLVQGMADEKQLHLESEVPEGLPLVVADPVRLKQILYNLLTNAVKFTPEGGQLGVTVRRLPGCPPDSSSMPLAPAGPEPAPYLEVAVWDSGIGIDPKDQGRIFEKFQQVDSSLSRRHGGAGLGLGLARKMVELHGGWMRVESKVGKGSTFRFALPENGPGRASAPANPAPESRAGQAGSGEPPS